MKSYDFDACAWDGAIYCNECLPDGVTTDEADPVFADSEWDHYPVCCHCGCTHDYVSLTSHGQALLDADKDAEPDVDHEALYQAFITGERARKLLGIS